MITFNINPEYAKHILGQPSKLTPTQKVGVSMFQARVQQEYGEGYWEFDMYSPFAGTDEITMERGEVIHGYYFPSEFTGDVA